MNTSIRTLESPVDKVSAFLFKNNILQESEYAPTMVHIDTIFMPVKDKENVPLLDSIMTAGLQTPLILINNTQENYDLAIRGIRPDLIQPRDESKSFLCYAGNQRLTAIKKLGYDTVHCLFVEDIHWAHAVHLVLQKGKIINESS